MALAGKMAAARFNTAEHAVFDYHVVCLAGDGCMQEGVAMEAVAFAGHQQLDNLILIYDANDVTLDAMADVTQSENAEAYFNSQNWDAVTIDTHNPARSTSPRIRSSSARGVPIPPALALMQIAP